MRTTETSEHINHDRRRLLGTAATGVAVAVAAGFFPQQPAAAGDAVRPFRLNVPEEQLVDLRRRIAATRWPDQETVSDRSQGVQLEKFQELVRYWGTGYDWRKVEARLNALPQFITEIDGLDIHFANVSEVFHRAGPGKPPIRGRDPERRSYFSYATFSDPDGNGWLLQEVTTRLPGRIDAAETAFATAADLAGALRRAAAAHGEHEKRTSGPHDDWPEWYAEYMVREQAGKPLPS